MAVSLDNYADPNLTFDDYNNEGIFIEGDLPEEVRSPPPLSWSPSARSLAERTPLLLDKETIRQQLGLKHRELPSSTENITSNQNGMEDYISVDDRVEDVLQKCFNQVIQPFAIFLCCIGWRPFPFEKSNSCLAHTVSYGYPIIVACLLFCNYAYGVIYAVLLQRTALLSELLLQAVVSFVLWSFGVWFFRREEGKAFLEISALIETVFLRCSDAVSGKLTQTALASTLRSYLAYGCSGLIIYLGIGLWVAIVNAIEIRDLFDLSTSSFIVMLTVVCIGYLAEYAVYVGTMVIYYICARLLIRYMDWLRDELMRRSIDIVSAEKEVFIIRKLVNDLNMGWAIALSLFSFSLFVRALLYHIRLIIDRETSDRVQAGVESAITVIIFFLCVYPAATVSWRGARLKSTAWKVRAEQKYRNSRRDELDSFYQFFMHAPLSARVLGFPFHRETMYALAFLVATSVFILWRVGLYDSQVP